MNVAEVGAVAEPLSQPCQVVVAAPLARRELYDDPGPAKIAQPLHQPAIAVGGSDLLDERDGSLDHLWDKARGEARDDEAVRKVARRFIESLRAA